MRVAHLLRKYDVMEWGGTETAMQGLAAGLAAQGVESIVYAPKPARSPIAPDPLAAIGCHVRRFRAWVPVWGISAERKRQLVAVGGNVISFDLFGAL
jgi:starch synthase